MLLSRLQVRILNLCLPESVVEHVCGDLCQEAHAKQRNGERQQSVQVWLWQQIVIIAWQKLAKPQSQIGLIYLALSICVFICLFAGVIFLSVIDDPSVISTQAWQGLITGNTHLLFLDDGFWQQVPTLFNEAQLSMFVEFYSLAYAALASLLLVHFHKQRSLSFAQKIGVSATLLSIPYLWGIALFAHMSIPLVLTGPIIAFMWLSIFYLLPITSYWILTKDKR